MGERALSYTVHGNTIGKTSVNLAVSLKTLHFMPFDSISITGIYPSKKVIYVHKYIHIRVLSPYL